MNKLLYFNINYQCNSNCIFCAANYGLDEVHPGIHYDEFCKTLQQQMATAGDRVVINGGEPTIHPEILKILTIANKAGCFIDLYTNGIRMSEKAFTDKIVTNTPMLVRIPVFGATAAKHDALTGHKGSYEKIMQAFENLRTYDEEKDDFYVEVKLLLSKATIGENLKIVQMFEKKFPGLFYFSLNPLIASEKVILNHSSLLEPLTGLVQKSVPLIEYAISNAIQLDINLIPFCLVPDEYRFMINLPDRGMLEEHYNDPFNRQHLLEKFETEKCHQCIYSSGCKGFPPHYFDVYNTNEVAPILVQ